jgi:hypothetical protein
MSLVLRVLTEEDLPVVERWFAEREKRAGAALVAGAGFARITDCPDHEGFTTFAPRLDGH